jgi:hypothetical protein
MSSVTLSPASRKTGKPVERSVRLTLAPCLTGPGVLDIRVGKDEASYYLTPLPSDFGRAFRLDKFGIDGGECYHVNLDTAASPGQAKHSCECKGWLRWNRCKHVEGLLALVGRGKL